MAIAPSPDIPASIPEQSVSPDHPEQQRKPISQRTRDLVSRFTGWIRGRNPNPDAALQELAAIPPQEPKPGVYNQKPESAALQKPEEIVSEETSQVQNEEGRGMENTPEQQKGNRWQAREGTTDDYFEINNTPLEDRDNQRQFFKSEKILVSVNPDTGKPSGYLFYNRIENHPEFVRIGSTGTSQDHGYGVDQVLVEKLKEDPSLNTLVVYAYAEDAYKAMGFRKVNYSGVNMEWRSSKADAETEEAGRATVKLVGEGINNLKNLLVERGVDAESLKAVDVEKVIKPGDIQLVPDELMSKKIVGYYDPDTGVTKIKESAKGNPVFVIHESLHKISRTANPEGKVWLVENLGDEDATKIEEGLTETYTIIAKNLVNNPDYYNHLRELDDENFEFQLGSKVYMDVLKERVYVPHTQRMSGSFIKEVSNHLGVSRCEAFLQISTDYLKGDFQAIVDKAGGVQAVRELLKDLPPAIPDMGDVFSLGIGKAT